MTVMGPIYEMLMFPPAKLPSSVLLLYLSAIPNAGNQGLWRQFKLTVVFYVIMFSSTVVMSCWALKGSKEEEMHFIKPNKTLVSYGKGTHKLMCCVFLPEQISPT